MIYSVVRENFEENKAPLQKLLMFLRENVHRERVGAKSSSSRIREIFTKKVCKMMRKSDYFPRS